MPTSHAAADPARVRALLRALADRLEADGDLRTPQWRAAVERVPRHVFIPRFYVARPGPGGVTEYAPVAPEVCGMDEWLARAYENETWVTQLDGKDASWDEPGPVTGIPTSSSTLPGLVVRMLEDLQVSDDSNVLEIGTGTAYSTALLCARLRDALVTSVEYDPALSNAAASRLATLGYHPTLVVADGTDGHAQRAPYDRIIATCSFNHVPPTWLAQAAPNALVLTTVVGSLSAYGYVRLTVDANGAATGRFSADQTVSFMPSRSHRTPAVRALLRPAVEAKNARRTPGRPTPVDRDTLQAGSFAWLAQLVLPDIAQVGLHVDGMDGRWVLAADGSWACLETRPGQTNALAFEGGPRRLWDEIESANLTWRELGRPSIGRYGLTVTPTAQHVWLDSPDSPHTWRLPA